MRGVHPRQQRQAVGRRFRHDLRADRGVGAGAVLDHDRLAPVLAHALADEARDDVGRPARRERHDDADRRGSEKSRHRTARPPERSPRQARSQRRGTKRARCHGLVELHPDRLDHLLAGLGLRLDERAELLRALADGRLDADREQLLLAPRRSPSPWRARRRAARRSPSACRPAPPRSARCRGRSPAASRRRSGFPARSTSRLPPVRPRILILLSRHSGMATLALSMPSWMSPARMPVICVVPPL